MSILVVDARGVGKTFGTGAGQVEALRDVDLRLAPGEFISLIGPSGCGKSTLLRLVGDLLSPTSGSLTVNGKDPHQARMDRDYGMVFQKATLLDWRTVKKNVELPLEIMDVGSADRSQRAWLHVASVSVEMILWRAESFSAGRSGCATCLAC